MKFKYLGILGMVLSAGGVAWGLLSGEPITAVWAVSSFVWAFAAVVGAP